MRRGLNRKDAAQILLRALELLAIAAVRAHLVDFLEHFGQRGPGHFIADIGGEEIEPRVGESGERGLRRIRVPLLLADVPHDPRVERAAVDRIGQRELVPAGIAPLHRDVSKRDRRLDAVRPLHEDDAPSAQGRRRREGGTLHLAARPRAECLFGGGDHRVGIDRADDQEERVVRAVMIAVKRHQPRAIHPLQRRLGLAGARVRMRAEQLAAERPVGQELRRRLLLRHRLQMLLLQDGELVLGDGRVHRHIRDEADQPRREL